MDGEDIAVFFAEGAAAGKSSQAEVEEVGSDVGMRCPGVSRTSTKQASVEGRELVC